MARIPSSGRHLVVEYARSMARRARLLSESRVVSTSPAGGGADVIRVLTSDAPVDGPPDEPQPE